MTAQEPKLKPLPPQISATERVVRVLRDALLSGVYSPGERLHESHIAKELNISKTPVREALARLRNSGLVEGGDAQPLTVTRVTEDTVRNLYELRLMVEPPSVKRAVPFLDEDTKSKARHLLETSARRGEARDLPHLSKANREFHELMCSRYDNPHALRVLRDIRDRLQFVAARGWIAEWSWETEWAEHEAIFRAVESGQADTAADLTRAHIEHAMARLVKVDLSQ